MASGQKKKTTGKARQGGGQSRQTGRSPQKNPRPPIRREVGGGVCLLLALCVVVSYFQADAIVLNLLGDLLKGLTGYGYWLAAPALALAGVNLLAHRGRPVALRTVCTLVTPVLLGAILHLFLYQGETVTGLGPMMKSLWADGLLLKSGGAVAGGLAAGMKRLVGTMVSVIVLLLLLAAALLAALVPPSTPAGCLPTIRWARPARRCIRRCTSPWASPAPSSTRPVCRTPSASSR